MMSAGIRSGVHCTRRKRTRRMRASVRTASVLPSPGTPSISACPPHTIVRNSVSRASPCPTMALASSARASRASSAAVSASRQPPWSVARDRLQPPHERQCGFRASSIPRIRRGPPPPGRRAARRPASAGAARLQWRGARRSWRSKDRWRRPAAAAAAPARGQPPPPRTARAYTARPSSRRTRAARSGVRRNAPGSASAAARTSPPPRSRRARPVPVPTAAASVTHTTRASAADRGRTRPDTICRSPDPAMFNRRSRCPGASIERFSIGVVPPHQTARPGPARANATASSPPSA